LLPLFGDKTLYVKRYTLARQNMSIEGNRTLEDLARQATNCRECFTLGEVIAARIDVALPRWVGERYWSAHSRVLILMCNPGEGLNYAESAERARGRLHQCRQGTETLGTIVKEQRDASWSHFYTDGLQLDVDETAFANVAWCATRGNVYPRTVLDRCFERHTEPLLRLLCPNVVLAAGRKVQAFLRVLDALPGTPRVIPILHHAHREGRKAKQIEFERVWRQLNEARAQCRDAG
jgi:hypothetical protein